MAVFSFFSALVPAAATGAVTYELAASSKTGAGWGAFVACGVVITMVNVGLALRGDR